MAYVITRKCIGCGACAKECPVEAIRKGNSVEPCYVIDMETCVGCGKCKSVCMFDVPVDEKELKDAKDHGKGSKEGKIPDYRKTGHGEWLKEGGLQAATKQDIRLYGGGHRPSCDYRAEGHGEWIQTKK